MAKPELPPFARAYVEAVTTLLFLNDAPKAADVLFVPGSADDEHARRAAELYRAGFAPLVLPSGRYAIGQKRFALTRGELLAAYPEAYQSEWAFLAAVLQRHGVPRSAILREDRATYTWQNAQFSREATDAAGIRVRRGLICCKPYHARRALTYYQLAYPETELLACPCDLPGVNADDWWQTARGRQIVLGEVERCGHQAGNEVFRKMFEGACP